MVLLRRKAGASRRVCRDARLGCLVLHLAEFLEHCFRESIQSIQSIRSIDVSVITSTYALSDKCRNEPYIDTPGMGKRQIPHVMHQRDLIFDLMWPHTLMMLGIFNLLSASACLSTGSGLMFFGARALFPIGVKSFHNAQTANLNIHNLAL